MRLRLTNPHENEVQEEAFVFHVLSTTEKLLPSDALIPSGKEH